MILSYLSQFSVLQWGPLLTYLCDMDFSSLIYQMGQFIISGVSDILIFSLPYKVQRAIVVTLTVVTLTSTWALVSHLKVLHRSLFMLWLRHCQVSYFVRGQVLFIISSPV